MTPDEVPSADIDLVADIREAGSVERQPDPKEFDLILGDQGHRSGRSDHRQNIGEIVGVDEQRTTTAQLDSFGIAAGSTRMLPGQE